MPEYRAWDRPEPTIPQASPWGAAFSGMRTAYWLMSGLSAAGHCHDAKTREQGDYLPPGLRDKHQHTEERREAKVTRAVLEQR